MGWWGGLSCWWLQVAEKTKFAVDKGLSTLTCIGTLVQIVAGTRLAWAYVRKKSLITIGLAWVINLPLFSQTPKDKKKRTKAGAASKRKTERPRGSPSRQTAPKTAELCCLKPKRFLFEAVKKPPKAPLHASTQHDEPQKAGSWHLIFVWGSWVGWVDVKIKLKYHTCKPLWRAPTQQGGLGGFCWFWIGWIFDSCPHIAWLGWISYCGALSSPEARSLMPERLELCIAVKGCGCWRGCSSGVGWHYHLEVCSWVLRYR